MKRVTRGIELLQRSTDSLAERWSRRGKSRAARFHRNEIVFVSVPSKCVSLFTRFVVSMYGGEGKKKGKKGKRRKKRKREKKRDYRERRRRRENLIYSKVNRLYRRMIFPRERFVCLYVELGRTIWTDRWRCDTKRSSIVTILRVTRVSLC